MTSLRLTEGDDAVPACVRKGAAVLRIAEYSYVGILSLGSSSLRFVPHEYEVTAPVVEVELGRVRSVRPAGGLWGPLRRDLEIRTEDGRPMTFTVTGAARWAKAIERTAALSSWTPLA